MTSFQAVQGKRAIDEKGIKMTKINPESPILVTGATGYVAGRLVEILLQKGHRVHAAIRDPDNAAKTGVLDDAAKKLPGTIHYFKSDLLMEGSFADAMQGCELVFHTASPFKRDVDDPVRDLMEPAVTGTRNVLSEADGMATVKRVVLTSSCAAIYGDNADLEKTPGGIYTEDIWNESSSENHQPYSYSKMLAEREAWKIHDRQNRWDLVTVNPSLVMGPGINPVSTSDSYAIMKQFAGGTFKAGIPRWGIGIVDVRDVAVAHYRAGFTPSAAGRYIVSGHNSDFSEIAAILRKNFGDAYPLPKRTLPKWLVWLTGPLINRSMTRKIVSRNVNYSFRADNSRSIRELGMSYRPLEETVTAFFEQTAGIGAGSRGSGES